MSSRSASAACAARHIQLIALGGTIGVGLFLGSARAHPPSRPRPAAGLCASAACAIFFIMRALGELLTYRPVAGSFATYAEEFVGPFAGFVTGWSYWFMWVVTAMAELTAIGIYVRFWFRSAAMAARTVRSGRAVWNQHARRARLSASWSSGSRWSRSLTIVALILSRTGGDLFPGRDPRGHGELHESVVAWRLHALRIARGAAHAADRDVRLLGRGADRRDRR